MEGNDGKAEGVEGDAGEEETGTIDYQTRDVDR